MNSCVKFPDVRNMRVVGMKMVYEMSIDFFLPILSTTLPSGKPKMSVVATHAVFTMPHSISAMPTTSNT